MKVVTDVYEADVPAEATVIDSTTDFRNKFGPSGDVVDRKTRICARGNQQRAGFDYGEVFAPTAAADTTRVLFAVAAHHDLHVHQVSCLCLFELPAQGVDSDAYFALIRSETEHAFGSNVAANGLLGFPLLFALPHLFPPLRLFVTRKQAAGSTQRIPEQQKQSNTRHPTARSPTQQAA